MRRDFHGSFSQFCDVMGREKLIIVETSQDSTMLVDAPTLQDEVGYLRRYPVMLLIDDDESVINDNCSVLEVLKMLRAGSHMLRFDVRLLDWACCISCINPADPHCCNPIPFSLCTVGHSLCAGPPLASMSA